jgi:hypothetical protein
VYRDVKFVLSASGRSIEGGISGIGVEENIST